MIVLEIDAQIHRRQPPNVGVGDITVTTTTEEE